MQMAGPPTVTPEKCSGCGKETHVLTFARAGTPYGDHLGLPDGEFAEICIDCMDKYEDGETKEIKNQLDFYSLEKWYKKSKARQQAFMKDLKEKSEN